MRYDIGKVSAPKMSSLEKGQIASKSCSKRPKKRARTLVFHTFSCFCAHLGEVKISSFELVWRGAELKVEG